MKKIIIAVICVLIAAGAVVGSYGIYSHKRDSKAVAEVVSVSLAEQQYWEDDLELDGYVAESNVQKITPDNEKLVEEVLVKEGDKVKKGDAVLKYDETALELDVQTKQNAVNMAEVNIQNAEKEIAKYKTLKPSELAPVTPDYPDEEDTSEEYSEENHDNNDVSENITSIGMAVSGDGTSDNPFYFVCDESTVVSSSVLENLKAGSLFACFTVEADQTYQWIIDGSKLDAENIADWQPSEAVSFDENGNISVDYSKNIIGNFKVLNNSSDDEEYDSEVGYFNNEESYSVKNLTNLTPVATAVSLSSNSEDYMYSRAELAQMISNKTEELKSLEIDKKTAELELKSAQLNKESGAILATIDGTVTEINENYGTDETYITISSSEGITVKGNIGEMNLDKIQVGSTITVSSWDTGEMATATVTSISETPVSYSSQMYNENPNSSTYEFTAQTDGETEISTDSGISISVTSETEDTGMYIPKVYVRKEDGKSYVMMADENNKLKKQYIQTGKIVYGYLVEVKSGLTSDDRICFPYGKNIKEGIKTKDTEEVLY